MLEDEALADYGIRRRNVSSTFNAQILVILAQILVNWF